MASTSNRRSTYDTLARLARIEGVLEQVRDAARGQAPAAWAAFENRLAAIESQLAKLAERVGGAVVPAEAPAQAPTEELVAAVAPEILASSFEVRPTATPRSQALANTAPARCFCKTAPRKRREFSPNIGFARASAISSNERYWPNGTTLRYFFFVTGIAAGTEQLRDTVRQGFALWQAVNIGLDFEEVSVAKSADLRIGFVSNDGCWSCVGRDSERDVERDERTMNFGEDFAFASADDALNIAAHEIGHALGFEHEHMSPFSPIQWNEDAVRSHFKAEPNRWDDATIESNVLRKLAPECFVDRTWDPTSIMEYPFAAALIASPEPWSQTGIVPPRGLSTLDQQRVTKLYPASANAARTQLTLMQSVTVSLQPGEQADFEFQPADTRVYRLQSLGGGDTKLMLYEENGGSLEFLGADDDGGVDRNAELQVTLVAGRRYVIKLKLFFVMSNQAIALIVS